MKHWILKRIDDAKKQYGARLKTMLQDPIWFIRIISWNHESPMTPQQEDMVRNVHHNQRSLSEAFRSSGKTESVLIHYPLFCMVTKPGWKGYTTSESIPQSVEIIRGVRHAIEDNPVLRKYIPSTRLTSWSKTEVELTNGSRYKCRPYSDRVRGEHVDFVGLDEVGQYRDSQIMLSAITPTVTARNGKIAGVGTPTSEMDMIHTLQENKTWAYKRFPADEIYTYRPEDNVVFQKLSGRKFYEVRYPDRTLEAKRDEIGNPIAFSREFLLRIMGGGDELFPHWLIEQSFDYEMSFTEGSSAEMGRQYFLGLDFALSTSTQADYSAYTVIERDTHQDNKLTVVRVEVYQGKSYDWQKNRIMELHEKYGFTRVLADEGTFGKTFITDLRAKGIPITGFAFQSKRQELLEVLRGGFEANFTGEKDSQGKMVPREHRTKRFILPKNRMDMLTHKSTEVLCSQLMHFVVRYISASEGMHKGSSIRFECTLKHDDMVMSLALAYWVARPKVHGMPTIERGQSALMHRVN